MITDVEWLSFGIQKKIVRRSYGQVSCEIGCNVTVEDYENIYLYDPKLADFDFSSVWIQYGLDNGLITKIGCVEHELTDANFIFTLQDVIAVYPNSEKRKNLKGITHIPENKDWFGYQGSDEEYTKQLLTFALNVNPSDTIIDIGCGLGDVLTFAKELGYKNVMGVEVQEELANEARKIPGAEIINISADEYLLPDKKMHIFLFNPFSNKIMNKFLSNNIDNIKRNNSVVIYNYAFNAHHLMVMYKLKQIFTDEFSTIYVGEEDNG